MLRRTPKAESLGNRDLPERMCEEDPDVDLVRQAIGRLAVDARELLYLKYRNELSLGDSCQKGLNVSGIVGLCWVRCCN